MYLHSTHVYVLTLYTSLCIDTVHMFMYWHSTHVYVLTQYTCLCTFNPVNTHWDTGCTLCGITTIRNKIMGVQQNPYLWFVWGTDFSYLISRTFLIGFMSIKWKFSDAGIHKPHLRMVPCIPAYVRFPASPPTYGSLQPHWFTVSCIPAYIRFPASSPMFSSLHPLLCMVSCILTIIPTYIWFPASSRKITGCDTCRK